MKKIFMVVGFLLLVTVPVFALTWNGQIYTLVNPTASTGDGAVFNLDLPYDKHTWCTTIVGSPSGVSVTLQGSLDNSLWMTLDTSTSTSSECRHVVNKPVKYIKTNVGTFTGGTTVKVTSIHMN